MYILGIDGGGTHTRVELRTSENEYLRRAEFGAFNMASIGEAGFRARLREVFADVGDMKEVESICIGGAGASGSAMAQVLEDELNRVGYTGKLQLCGDHEIALAGAMEGPGCILIAGTGSICCGRNERGDFARCGGWGHLLDDCGSAYALGREALSTALRTEDGRLPENALHRAVMHHLGAESARDIVNFAYYGNAGKAEIASLAPLVLEAAGTGDEQSIAILESQAAELRKMAAAVIEKLELQTPRLALLGGLLERDNIYSRMVRQSLSTITQIVPPSHDALWGAAELAFHMVKGEK